MTATEWRLPAVVAQGDLGAYGVPLSQGDGQSKGIFPLDAHPGWLVKVYKEPLDAATMSTLDALVAVAGSTEGVLRRHACWPVARLADGTGCVLPQAPEKYRARLATGVERFLEVDFLAKPDETFAARGLPVPTAAQRQLVCRGLVAVGTALEEHRLVYSDWSYSNAFWSPADWSAYVIDVDGCRTRQNQNINQPNWEDPLTPAGSPADLTTDRYRLALLVARCLTGRRDLPGVLHAVAALPDPALRDTLLDMLMSTDRMRRPTVSQLGAVLTGLPFIRVPAPRRPMPVAAPPTVVLPEPRTSDTIPAAAPGNAARVGLVALAIIAALIVLVIVITTIANS